MADAQAAAGIALDESPFSAGPKEYGVLLSKNLSLEAGSFLKKLRSLQLICDCIGSPRFKFKSLVGLSVTLMQQQEIRPSSGGAPTFW